MATLTAPGSAAAGGAFGASAPVAIILSLRCGLEGPTNLRPGRPCRHYEFSQRRPRRAAPDGDLQGHVRAGARTGVDDQLPAQFLGPPPHAVEAVAVAVARVAQAPAVVAQPQRHRAALDPERDVGLPAPGMARDVVDRLLEDEEDFAADFGADSHVLFRVGRVEAELYVACGEAVAGEPAHPLREVAQVVTPGVHRPDDVAHRVDRAAGDRGDHGEPLGHLRVGLPRLLAQHLAQARDQREVRPDVVVQVRGDACAYAL